MNPESTDNQNNPVLDDEAREESAAARVGADGENDSAENAEGAGEEPGARLAKLEAEAAEAKDQLLRALAENENLRRRHSRDLENAHKFALDSFVKELLAVRDSLELGHGAASEPDVGVEKLREGTELTLKLLGDVMGKFGVEQVDPVGEPFDPELHQAISMQPSAELAPNTVATVVQKGYVLNGRLVRPAMVIVSQGA